MLFKQNEYPSWKVWDLTALTQKWVKVSGPGSAPNYGVILWATNEDTNSYDLRFRSSEYTDTTAHQPKLEVIWSTTPKTVYFLKDHLGSIRATVLDSPERSGPVIGYDDYDPWGYPLASRTKAIPTAYLQGASKNKFTGKEYDDELGLNWTWIDRRSYMPDIGRWGVREPLAHMYPGISPYAYTLNNPVKYFDAIGAYTVSSQELFGSVYATARRVTFEEAQFTELSGRLPGIGLVTPMMIKYGIGDPSFPAGSSDWGSFAIDLILKGTGGFIGQIGGGLELLPIDIALSSGETALDVGSALVAGDAALGLDEITFEVANSINLGGVKFGSLDGFGDNTFTLSQELTLQARNQAGAERLLRENLGRIRYELESIVKARNWNLSKRTDREALRAYIGEHKSEFEEILGIEFIEE